jgi:hypothetical protein
VRRGGIRDGKIGMENEGGDWIGLRIDGEVAI